MDSREVIGDVLPELMAENVESRTDKEREELLRIRYRYLERLYRISQAVTRATKVDELCDRAVSELLEALGADRCAILLFDDNREMHFCASSGLSDSYQTAVDGHTPWTPEDVDAEPILIPDIESDQSLSSLHKVISKEGIRAMAFIPIVGQSEVLGKFMIYMDAPHEFSREEVWLCSTFSSHVAHMIERAKSQALLQESRNELLDDVSGREKTESALRESEERLRQSLKEVQSLNDTLEERVRNRTKQVRALASVLTLAEQRERHRISQVLHDDLQQMLYGQLMNAGILRRSLTQLSESKPAQLPDSDEGSMVAPRVEALDRAQHLIERLELGLEQAIDATRTLAVELNPPILKSEGFVEALKWLGRHMEDSYQVKVRIDVDQDVAYPAGDTRTLLIQMIRELLFNVVKHADIGHTRVRVRTTDSTLRVSVQDEGKGFDVEEIRKRQRDLGGYGLFSIEERLALVGGSLEIESGEKQGTTVTIGLPLETAGGASGDR